MKKFILNKDNNSKKLIIGISILFCAVIFVLGGTFAFFTQSDSKNTDNIATTNVTLDYKDNTTYMRNNLIPVVESDVTKFASKNLINSTDERKYSDEDICHYKDDMYACSLYEFTITNTANVSQNIMVSMTPIINEYNNFYFILYESKVNEINNELNKIETNTKIEQDTINFNNTNVILKPEESKTYTIVFYIKNLDIPQDDANKRFTASILVNSITTGYKKVVQLGEGCYDFEMLEDNTLKLTKFNGINHETGDIIEGCGVTKDENNLYSVTIPSTYAGVAVSTLGNTLFSAAKTLEDGTITGVNQFINIEKITISEGVTTIENGFVDMENMKGKGTFLGIGGDFATFKPNPDRTLEVNLPNSLTYIGELAFSTTAIRELEIPVGVESIGIGSFSVNSSLTTLTFEDGSRLITIGDSAFGNSKLTTLTIPNSVQTIGDSAFFDSQLTELAIPNSVQSIGDFAFFGTELISITLGNSVQTIGSHAFMNSLLTELTIPDSVTSIGHQAFMNSQLTELTIPDSVTSIGHQAFRNSQLTELTLGDNVQTIGDSAFYNSQLTELTLGDNVQTIGDKAFYHSDLTYLSEDNPLIIPSSVTSIGSSAFWSNPNGTDDYPYNRNLKYIKFKGKLKEDNPTDWYNSENTKLITTD